MFSFSQLLTLHDIASYLCIHRHEFIDLIYDFDAVKRQQNEIEEFIQLQYDKIQSLDFRDTTHKAFVYSLLDVAQKIDSPSCFEKLYQIALAYGISIDACTRAAKLYMLDTVFDNSKYLDIFNEVCELLDYAIAHEDDNENRALALFTSYYNAVSQRNPIWIDRLRQLIISNRNAYKVLSYTYIDDVLAVDVADVDDCYNRLNHMRDNLLRPVIANTVDVLHGTMETDTDYAREVESISEINVPAIRKIALRSSQSEMLRGRGVSPLETEEEMNLYLRNYGNMHYAKLQAAINFINLSHILSHAPSVEIIDWGCGQGLATITLLEKILRKGIHIEHCLITLIEPSDVCIKRAALNITEALKRMQSRGLIGHCTINTVCKGFDALRPSDIHTSPSSSKIHLFSNVLDVELFSISALESYIIHTYKGSNLFVCASPHINDSKTERVRSFTSFFHSSSSYFDTLGEDQTSNTSSDSFWECNNHFKGYLCDTHPTKGCTLQWTKVISVFYAEW